MCVCVCVCVYIYMCVCVCVCVHEWSEMVGHMLCTVKWVKKVSCGGVFDLAVEQPQLFRKTIPKNKIIHC